MSEFLSPKQVARAIQVSESSVKRWCDKGIIDTQYTAGGHRRIAASVLIDFLRASKYELVQPDILGLPATIGQTAQAIDQAMLQVTEALLRGDEEQCRQIIFDLYLAEHRMSVICDVVFAKAFENIGDLWQCGDAEVYQERRACELALRIFHELRMLLPPPPPDAPLAIGGTVEGDQYNLATTMVELVLRDNNWNASSLGSNLPYETLAAAIKHNNPKLFWISASHLVDETRFIQGYSDLYEEFGSDVAFVVGGRALNEELRRQMKYAAYCDNVQHLEGFAQTLLSATEKPSTL